MKYILVYVQDKVNKIILWLNYFSILYCSTYDTYPDLIFFSHHHHTTIHTHRFRNEFNLTKLFSKLYLLLLYTDLHTVPLLISYFSLFITILIYIYIASESDRSIFLLQFKNFIYLTYVYSTTFLRF